MPRGCLNRIQNIISERSSVTKTYLWNNLAKLEFISKNDNTDYMYEHAHPFLHE